MYSSHTDPCCLSNLLVRLPFAGGSTDQGVASAIQFPILPQFC